MHLTQCLAHNKNSITIYCSCYYYRKLLNTNFLPFPTVHPYYNCLRTTYKAFKYPNNLMDCGIILQHAVDSTSLYIVMNISIHMQ